MSGRILFSHCSHIGLVLPERSLAIVLRFAVDVFWELTKSLILIECVPYQIELRFSRGTCLWLVDLCLEEFGLAGLSKVCMETCRRIDKKIRRKDSILLINPNEVN